MSRYLLLSNAAALRRAWAPPQDRRRPFRATAIFSTLLIWMERSRLRRTLVSLEDHQLRDIGLARFDVWRATSKPFWRK